MKKKLLLIILLQIFIFSGFAQDKTAKTSGTATTQSFVEPIDPPEPCDNCQTNYQWNYDFDGDGYGDPNIYVFAPTKPNRYVPNQQDCDDSNPNIKTADAVWYRDVDGDGRGAKNGPTTKACTRPDGYSDTDNDLDDNNGLITEVTPQKFYFDDDGDTFGDPNVSLMASPGHQPVKYVTNNLDLDDHAGLITNITPRMYYWDRDHDDYGDELRAVLASPGKQPEDYVDKAGDCNNNATEINPETKWYADFDGDKLGDPLKFIQQCTQPVSYVRDNTDNCPSIYGTSADCLSIPVPDINYIISTTYKKETSEVFVNPTPDQAQTNITYFDGLGRPIQQIANQSSATGKDIITHIDYDDLGRQTKEFLPFASNQTTLTYMLPSVLQFQLTEQYKANYGNTNDNPFSDKQLEPSPLNRVLKQAAPGNEWRTGSGHEIKMDYQSNAAGEVIYYYAATTWNATLGLYTTKLSTGVYEPNVLYKTITYDENTAATPSETNGSTVEFKNKQGQVVLKRTYGTVENSTVNEKHDTYYVYDIYGNLTFVIPPKASGSVGGSSATGADITSTSTVTLTSPLQLTATNSIRLLDGFHAQAGSTFSAVITTTDSQSVLDNLCYQYKYDSKNRLVEKKLPGKQWEFIVYDKLDRPVATGPANSPFSDINTAGWLITKYDAFNRPVYTGWMNTPATADGRVSLQNAQNSSALTVLNENKQASGTIDGIPAYYSNVVAPTNFKLLTVNYYDNYTFPGTPAIAIPTSVEGQGILTATKGLATASWTRVLTSSTSNKGETTATFYEAKARPVRTFTQNFLGGYTYTDSKLDSFSGQLEYSITKHNRLGTGADLVTKDAFTYSPQDRLLTQTHQINGAEPAEVILSNTYNDLGQLISKKTGNNTQNVNYTYNIRGWLESINDVSALSIVGDPKDLFAFKINYSTANTPGVDPLFNGNIAETYWTSTSEANPLVRGYGYAYDKLNRLKTSIFKRNGAVNNAYDENLSYDKNGNIMSIIRNGNNETAASRIDDLSYSYGAGNLTNQLTKVIDSSDKALGFVDSASNTADDYAYDVNGNMIRDNNKNIIEIKYNHLNLPTKITFNSKGNIEYIYNAAGQKVQKIVNETGKPAITTDYLGGYQYNNNTLKFFPTAEGYVEPSGSSYKYVYQYKDHLGNIRLSYADSNKDGIISDQTGTQLVWEDGFENPIGWDGTGASWGHALDAFDTTVKHSGNRSGRIDVHIEDVSRSVHSTQWISINNAADTQYRISGWVLLENIPQWSRARLELMMKKEGETEYMTLYDYQYITTKGEWVYVEKIITVPAYIRSINSRITLDYRTGTTKGSAWFDELKIEKVISNAQNEILEENNYYPFGLKQTYNSNLVVSTNPALKYKYNNKELQDELGLNFYDYGARNYDPALGRWMNIDPLAEKSRRFNPYTYALNNPVYFIDPDGMMAGTPPPPDWFVNSQTGEVIHNKNETKGYENKLGGNWEHLAKEKEIVDTNPKNNKEGNVKYSAEQSANLMEKNDRELAPKTVLSETTVRTTVSAITPGGAVTVQNTTTDEIWANVTYVPTGSQSKTESSTILQDETLSNGYSQVKISEKSYSAPSIVADVMNFLGNLLYPDGSNESKHYVNWKNYPKDGKLNEFKKAISN